MCASTWGGGGYLPQTGPSPLKFQDTPMRFDPAAVLPPLKMSDQPSRTNTTAVSQSSTNLNDGFEVLSPAEPEPQTTTVSSSVNPSPIPDLLSNPPQGNGEVTPQLLLRYFNKSGSQETLVTPQIPFTPPPPLSLRGSSATYSSE